MLDISQVSEFAKNRVIEILSRGVNRETVEMCGVGLASDAVAPGLHIEDENDISQFLRVIQNARPGIEEYKNNERAYGRLALQIYSRHIADKFVETESEHYLGPEA